MTTLRYGSIVQSLWSLRGRPHVTVVRPTETVVYRDAKRGGVPPLADIYIPAEHRGASVVLVHGGAFVIGSRQMKPMRYLAARLVAEGIAVCAIDYRMIFRGGRLDEALDDVVDGISFWGRESERRGLDPSRISVVGLSAGGTLSWLAADRLGAPRIHRLVSCFGLYDMAHLQGRLGSLLPRLLFATADREAWQRRSPSALTPAMPTLLLHGTEDGMVPVEHAQRIADDREQRGLPTKLVIYQGAPHGFFNNPCEAAEAGTREIIDYVTASSG